MRKKKIRILKLEKGKLGKFGENIWAQMRNRHTGTG